MTGLRADAVLLDKDGTLFDFSATWDVWAEGLLETLSGGEPELRAALARAVRYDLGACRFRKDSVVIAGTNREAAACLVSVLPEWSLARMERYLITESALAPLVPAVPLGPFTHNLRALGLKIGVVTNDSEEGARAHLGEAGVAQAFDFIAGYDSGFGAKPEPGPLLAFARAVDVAPARVVMVGDSRHDLVAGRGAGMSCVGVLTGPAQPQDLASLADAVIPDIGHLVDWLRGTA